MQQSKEALIGLQKKIIEFKQQIYKKNFYPNFPKLSKKTENSRLTPQKTSPAKQAKNATKLTKH